MSYRYEKLYIMHYGVGHDKGGHSGRYPWGSGKNPYGGVDPTTKKSDLFKLNGRKFNDVASDLIVKKKYGNRTDVTEEQIAQSKARTQAFLRGLEATIGTAVIGAVGNISLSAISNAARFDQLAKNSADFTKKYVDAQTGLLDLYNSQSDKSGFAARSIRNKMSYNQVTGNSLARNGRNPGQAEIGLWKADDLKNYLPKENKNNGKGALVNPDGSIEKTFDFSQTVTWDNADIKTFENSIKSDFDDFQKQWDETNRKIEEGKSRMNASKEYWDELEFNSKKNNW